MKLYSISVLFIGLSCFWTLSSVLGAAYYVSPDGKDQNDGRTPQTAWASIERVNAAEEILPGDSILWERGGVWRGCVRPHSGEPGKPVTYGTYGSSKEPLPTFLGSVDASCESAWEEVSPNVWATRETKPELIGNVDGKLGGKWSVNAEKGLKVRLTQMPTEKEFGRLEVDCQNAGSAPNQVQLWGPEVNPDLFPETMQLTLKVRASRKVSLPQLRVSLNRAPWSNRVTSAPLELTGEWQTIHLLLNRNGARPNENLTKKPTSNPSQNSSDSPQISKDRFFWHWSFGGVPADTKIEIVFQELKEAKIDRSLFFPIDVGNLIFDHGQLQEFASCGVKKWNLSDLGAPGDFFWDGASGRVFLYWNENPAKTCESIEVCVTRTIFNQSGCHDLVYENLAVAYGAAHGFGGGNTARITIRNCDVFFIGGGLLHWHPDGTPGRYGNGIEFWNSAEDHLVENCHLWEIYDAALTNQGRGSETAPSVQRRITYRGNRIEKAEYSFEYWNHGGVTEDVLFERNVCVDSGFGWAHAQRRDPNGAHLMLYHNSAPTSGVVIRENQFLNSTEVCVRMGNDWRSGLTLEKNEYQQPDGAPVIRWLGKTYFTKETFSDWQKTLGMDRDSICR